MTSARRTRPNSSKSGQSYGLGEVERELQKRVGTELVRRGVSIPWCPHTPQPKQRIFLGLTEPEALYGGAAGGGKSDALLMGALEDVNLPGYSAILFRRTYAEGALNEAIMDRSHEWLTGTPAHWDGLNKTWRFPASSRLAFGYLDNPNDRFRYQSAQFHYIGFDEVTQFKEPWYTYLLSRLRRGPGSKIRLRARAASNPGGIGHDWVKARFVDPGIPGCVFVPANLADNAFVDAEDYRLKLARLDETTRRQLLEGEWIRDSGALYPHFSKERSIIAKAPDDGAWTYGLALDFGVVDANGIAVIGYREYDTCVYILEAYEMHGTPTVVAEEVQSLEKRYDFSWIVGDVGGLGKAYSEEMRDRFSIPIEPAEKQNKMGYIRLLGGEQERGTVKVIAHKCAELVDQWGSLMLSEDGSRELAGQTNHAADAALYGWRKARAHHADEAPKDKPKPDSAEYWALIEKDLEENRLAHVMRRKGEWWEQ